MCDAQKFWSEARAYLAFQRDGDIQLQLDFFGNSAETNQTLTEFNND